MNGDEWTERMAVECLRDNLDVCTYDGEQAFEVVLSDSNEIAIETADGNKFYVRIMAWRQGPS